MNTINDFDRRAAAWLADGPTELNDRVLDAALREVHLTRQRRRWSAPWRTEPMSRAFRAVAMAAATVVVVGFLAVQLRGPAGPGAAPLPSVIVVDGAWQACPTEADILAAGGTTPEAAENAGCTTLTLRDGVFRETGGSAATTVPGSYIVTGTTIAIHRSNGEVFDFSWSVGGNTLNLTRSSAPNAISPAPWLAKPFQRVGT